MDINGAKALRERLGSNGAGEASTSALEGDIPEEAPPVYHWLGVRQAEAETPRAESDNESTASGASWFRRLGLSFR